MKNIARIRAHRNRTGCSLRESVLAVKKADLCYKISLLSWDEFERLNFRNLNPLIEQMQSEDNYDF